MELPEFIAEAFSILSELHSGSLRYPDAVEKLRDLAERFHRVTKDKSTEALVTKIHALRSYYGKADVPEDAFQAIMDCPHNEPTHYNPKGCSICTQPKP